MRSIRKAFADINLFASAHFENDRLNVTDGSEVFWVDWFEGRRLEDTKVQISDKRNG